MDDRKGSESQRSVALPLSTEDATLVEALRRAEHGAAEALYRRLSPFVWRTLRGVLRRATIADHEDLAQVTFERVIKTVLDGRFEGACSLRTWASSIAVHAALDHSRKVARERQMFAEDTAASEAAWTTDTEAMLDARAELSRVQGILSRMREKDARALLLHDVFGWNLVETAAALGVSQVAAQSRLTRARKELLRRSLKLKSK